ncbi:MAG TPA: carbonate dehydratase [Thiolinea sp.]|nr:carbonate dehydratase [Thiolinea sp.]
MKTLNPLFEKNLAWATALQQEDPDFFTRLANQQHPELLWIGCADSRVPANQIIDLPPGEVFVHRNIANLVVHTDLNCLSVIEFAVEVLAIRHIIVCGHYGCSGIRAAMDNQEYGVIDNWLRHIKDVARFNAAALEGLPADARHDRLAELNVIEQVANVCNTSTVRNAWRRGHELSVHGWIYDIRNGILKDLDMCISRYEQLEEKYRNV